MQRTILIDRDKCVGGYSCIVACKLEHNLPPYPVSPPVGNPKGPELIRVYQFGPQISDDKVRQHFQPILCMHCLDAPCIGACPRSAIDEDIDTGVVLVDEEKCIGCKSCLSACPYGAPEFHHGKLCLCDLCIHRLGDERPEGRYAACEAACQAGAIRVGTTGEIPATLGKKAAERATKERSV